MSVLESVLGLWASLLMLLFLLLGWHACIFRIRFGAWLRDRDFRD